MKVLLLIDNNGSELELFKNVSKDLVLELTDGISGHQVSYTFDKEDIEYLICELARLRDINV